MSQNCECNYYSLLTANTGVAIISAANPNLTGLNATRIISGVSNGTTIKSVRIKATGPVTTGMVRLFVGTGNAGVMSLYKEIPVQTTPELTSTPTPSPILQTYEINLVGELKLQTGDALYATTQNSEGFNVIAEGLDWKYPATLPPVCCNFKQETAVTGLGTVSAGNVNLDGSGTIVPVFTAPAGNGTYIKTITIKALQSTNENGMIRIFINPNGAEYFLMQELPIPQTNQSSFEPSFKMVLNEDMCIKQGCIIGVSTQLSQSFAITIDGSSWSYPIS